MSDPIDTPATPSLLRLLPSSSDLDLEAAAPERFDRTTCAPSSRRCRNFGAAASGSPAPRGGGCWSALLTDLGCLEPLWLRTAVTGVELTHRTHLAGMRTVAGTGRLSCPRHALRLVLDRCRSLRADPENPEQVSIENQAQEPLLTFLPDSADQGFLLRVLLAVHNDLGDDAPPASDLACSGGVGTDARGHEAIDSIEARILDGIDDRDVSELSGRLAFRPCQLRDRGAAVAVEPDLIGCALETLVDQVVPLRVISGNDGVTQRLDAAFYAYARQGSWLQLSGEGVRLRIGTQALHTAWVFQRGERLALSRELRLYDANGRALVIMGAAPTPDGREPAVWRAVMDALLP